MDGQHDCRAIGNWLRTGPGFCPLFVLVAAELRFFVIFVVRLDSYGTVSAASMAWQALAGPQIIVERPVPIPGGE
jgi:hypothetical protein